MIGDTYLERGKPVIVLVAWVGKRATMEIIAPGVTPFAPQITLTFNRYASLRAKRAKGAPRNVLIQRENGELVVRSFRGLRKPPARAATKPAKVRVRAQVKRKVRAR
jgi:hypothetical protein